MADENVQTESAVEVVAAIDIDRLKALLTALGHDVEAKWEHLLALATK